jgi:hypothetical protein
MSGDKTTQQSSQSQQTQYTPTALETKSNQLDYNRKEAAQPGLLAADASGLDLTNKLLTGQSLPGYLNALPGGIDTNAQNSIANQSVRMINPYLNQGGILDSGTAASVGAKTVGDVYRQSQEFNLGNLLNLLNLSSGFSAQVQQPISQSASTLSGSLAGLRGVSSSGTSSGSTIGMNPFLKSFSQSAGRTLGSPYAQNSSGTFGFGGGA